MPVKRRKYDSLTDHLRGIDREAGLVEMSFQSIETIIGRKLPYSTHEHREWWANSKPRANAYAWVGAGWRVDEVDMDNRKVRFRRNTQVTSSLVNEQA